MDLKWLDSFSMEQRTFEGQTVTIIFPDESIPGKPWAWKGEFLNAFPKTELALLGQGFHIVHMAYPNQFGSPKVLEKWNRLHRILTTKEGFHPRPAMIGLSRGGLYCYQWAIHHPEKVSCIYGDAPVCDMRSWPGGKGTGPGSPKDWDLVMEAFEFSNEDEAMAFTGNPVDQLQILKDHNIPILHVYGDADEVVPWEENTGVVAERYQKMGGSIELISKPGCLHHPHGLEDPTPVVQFILKHTKA